MSTELEAEDFLELLWGDVDGPDRGWVDLPAKVNGYWVPYPMEWPPNEDIAVSRRIDRSLRDGEDLYFSVARFSERGRSIEDVLPVAWLWADLDEVHPSVATGMGLMPTIAVESSPGRYQAYWQLTQELKPTLIEKLNRALTYALGADKGGWDLTQVLRIVGTRNHKYKGAPRVRLLWHREGLVYKARYVMDKVREHVPADELKGVTGTVLPRKPIPRKAKQLLWAKADEVVEGERSDRLWELNCLLAEAGLEETEIYSLVVHCVWNKWAGQRSGAERLRGDIRKAMTHVRRKAVERRREKSAKGVVKALEDSGALAGGGDLRADRAAGGGDDDGVAEVGQSEERDSPRLSLISYSALMAMVIRRPKWMIEDIWTARSHGIIGGEPKTSKTTLALAMGLAVASGCDFLGRYRVGTQGPVLMIQEENDLKLMQTRVHQLAAFSGLIDTKDAHVTPPAPGSLDSTIISVDLPGELPFWLVNKSGFDLSEEGYQEALQDHLDELKPELLILDPMYLIFGGVDSNSMRDLQPLLKGIIQIADKFGCSVALVHHMGKQNQATLGRRAGQRLLGSATLHGFTDSALYTTKVQDPRSGWTRVRIEREFRALSDQEPIDMAWNFSEGLDVSIDFDPPNVVSAALPEVLDGVLGDRRWATVTQLAREVGVGSKTIRRRIESDPELEIRDMGPGKSARVYRVTTNGASPQG
jgi:hypothetical protein